MRRPVEPRKPGVSRVKYIDSQGIERERFQIILSGMRPEDYLPKWERTETEKHGTRN